MPNCELGQSCTDFFQDIGAAPYFSNGATYAIKADQVAERDAKHFVGECALGDADGDQILDISDQKLADIFRNCSSVCLQHFQNLVALGHFVSFSMWEQVMLALTQLS